MRKRGRTAASLIDCYASIGIAQLTKAGIQIDIVLADTSVRPKTAGGVMQVEPDEFSQHRKMKLW